LARGLGFENAIMEREPGDTQVELFILVLFVYAPSECSLYLLRLEILPGCDDFHLSTMKRILLLP